MNRKHLGPRTRKPNPVLQRQRRARLQCSRWWLSKYQPQRLDRGRLSRASLSAERRDHGRRTKVRKKVPRRHRTNMENFNAQSADGQWAEVCQAASSTSGPRTTSAAGSIIRAVLKVAIAVGKTAKLMENAGPDCCGRKTRPVQLSWIRWQGRRSRLLQHPSAATLNVRKETDLEGLTRGPDPDRPLPVDLLPC